MQMCFTVLRGVWVETFSRNDSLANVRVSIYLILGPWGLTARLELHGELVAARELDMCPQAPTNCSMIRKAFYRAGNGLATCSAVHYATETSDVVSFVVG